MMIKYNHNSEHKVQQDQYSKGFKWTNLHCKRTLNSHLDLEIIYKLMKL